MTTQLVISANSKRLRLTPTGLCAQDGELYHFRSTQRGPLLKIDVGHTAAYCERMGLACSAFTDVTLYNPVITELLIQGYNNNIVIDLTTLRTHQSLLKLTLTGSNNMIRVCCFMEKLDILMKGDSSEGENSLDLEGKLVELCIESSRRFGLNARRLELIASGTITTIGSSLITLLIKPTVGSASWNMIYRAPPPKPVAPPSPETVPIPPSSNSDTPKRKRENKKPSVKDTQMPSLDSLDTLPHQEQLHLRACPICLQNVPNAACVPCGHVLCAACASFLNGKTRRGQLLRCPESGCSTPVERVLRLVLPLQFPKLDSSSSSTSDDKNAISLD